MHTAKKKLYGAALAGLLALGCIQASAQGDTFGQIQRGRYLSKAGDCISCHTAQGGKPYAGGFPVATPFGIIYSTNITPDPETGIGKWSGEDFFKAMHYGVRRDGKYLYPAFPYPWFTKLSRADVDAIKAYLDTIKPVKQADRPSELPWPLSWRASMAGWNRLYFHAGQYQADPRQSDVWNRGAYLVQGAAHCAACHTAKNLLGASTGADAFGGGDAGNSWYAPSLAEDKRDGLAGWSRQDIVQYLKTGTNGKTSAAGPMVDVVMNSTQYLSDDDLNAIAVYLKSLPAKQPAPGEKAPAAGRTAMAHGRALYTDNCTGCHMAKGTGLPHTFPSLADSSSIQASDPSSVIQMILAGGRAPATRQSPTGLAMPSFAGKLDDAEVADLTTYIRNAWGNHAPATDADKVAKVRQDVRKNPPGMAPAEGR